MAHAYLLSLKNLGDDHFYPVSVHMTMSSCIDAMSQSWSRLHVAYAKDLDPSTLDVQIWSNESKNINFYDASAGTVRISITAFYN